MEVKKQTEHIRPLLDTDPIRVKTTGHITELMWQSRRSYGGCIRKISKDLYEDTRSGEVFEFKHADSRADDLSAVARSLAKGRDLINTNVDDVTRCRWITLTYAENMTDPKKLYKDFENFNKRLRDQIGSYEYITAAEPQGRGAWHLHIVMIFPGKAPFIDYDTLFKAWKQGTILKVKALDNVDNVGAYLTAYLGDMELKEFEELPEKPEDFTPTIKEVEFTDDHNELMKKRYVKGARLHMYPPQFHIFRWSKGIKQPAIEVMSKKRAEEKVSAATLTFERTLTLSDPGKDFESTLNYRYYNSKRNGKSNIV